MIVFLLLVIIAILLFGSSAVLGVVGGALGVIAAIFAIALGIQLYQTYPLIVGLTLAGSVGFLSVAFYILHRIEKRQLDEMNKQYQRRLDAMGIDYRED